MTLKLTNTLTKRVEDIAPAHPDGILRLYHCGPTVYSTPHFGNLRRFLVADLLTRTARFLGYKVRSVMNITDVGHLLDPGQAVGSRQEAVGTDGAGRDRMLIAAERERLTPEQVAAKYTAEFFQGLAALRAEPADYYPRATMHVPQMQRIIAALVAKGLAYETASGVYFETAKFRSYGKLSGNTVEAIQAGARVGVREDKRHPADFALWVKAPPEHLVQWDSPWGRGYPGWHIECSAMSMQILGETVDIHTGGQDNIFPHHENEIAQSEGATGAPFVRTWVHNEFLESGDGKMSKSEGATLTLRDLTDRGIDPLAFRLLVFQTHYRSKLHFSWGSMEAAATALQSLRGFVQRLRAAARSTSSVSESDPDTGADTQRRLTRLEETFTAALADDLGSPPAVAAIFDFMRAVNPALEAGTLAAGDAEAIQATLRKLDSVLAVLDVDAALPSPQIPAEVRQLVDEREAARGRQDFGRADQLRSAIRAKGFAVEDTPRGPRVSPRET